MNCPLCSTAAKFFTTGENREYQLCNLCGLIFVPPEFHISVESEITRYREHENSLDNQGYVNMFMKKITLILLTLLLTACSNHMVKVGKRCTPLGNDNTYEKSFVWLVNKANLKSFDEKINKLNCDINEEKI